MPKFYRQNKKRVDPRYFLKEHAINEGIKDYIKWLLAQDFLDHYTKK